MSPSGPGVDHAPPIAFGPLASRRLGRSLGVNNIPPKHCSYSCVYCQVGPTTTLETERRTFHAVEQVVAAVSDRVAACRAAGQALDCLTFAPDGEPTLDIGLGQEIRGLRPLNIPIVVITNGSLLFRPDVRAEVALADIVSVKVDAGHERGWRRVDRPARSLALRVVREGIRRFAAEYRGRLLTETMLVAGAEPDPGELEGLADLLASLAPEIAYLAVPTRPPPEGGPGPPTSEALAAARAVLTRRLRRVEVLAGEPSCAVRAVADPGADLLGILAVHPLREAEVQAYLARSGASGAALDTLIASGRMVKVRHGGEAFYASTRRAKGLPSRSGQE